MYEDMGLGSIVVHIHVLNVDIFCSEDIKHRPDVGPLRVLDYVRPDCPDTAHLLYLQYLNI